MSKTHNYRKRQAVKSLRDTELSETDKKYHLCRMTGYTYRELWDIACQTRTRKDFLNYLHYDPWVMSSRFYKWDNKIWVIAVQWSAMFVKQWEAEFRKFMDTDLTLLPELDQQEIYKNVSIALGIEAEVLQHLIKNQDQIELFLESTRSTLGTLAETKLWSLVAQGDAATIRWLLPKIKSDIYGDKLVEEAKERVIKIIDI